MEDEGREEEEEPQEESQSAEMRLPVEEDDSRYVDQHTHGPGPARGLTPGSRLSTPPADQLSDGPVTTLKTVKQQLAFLRRKQQLSQQTRTLWTTAEPQTLRLDQRQRLRLQQQLQQVRYTCPTPPGQCDQSVTVMPVSVCQHVQLLTQVHLLSSPVAKLHSEAETTRQFLVTHTHTHSVKCGLLCRVSETVGHDVVCRLLV